MIKLRRATISDFSLVHDFEIELSEFERSLGTCEVKPTGEIACYSDEQLKQFLTDANTYFLIAEVNGNPAGCGFAQIRNNNPIWDKNDKHAYIGLIYVREAYRKMGVASKITAELTNWAKDKGIREMRLKAFTVNKPALTVYEKQGFTNLVTELIKQI